MPFFATSQEWQDQSLLLIEARPNTTRITTRYSLKPVTLRDGTEAPARGSLVLTTYDPVLGVNLKYRTTKAAEVTRLMHSTLGRLGRCMAGVGDVVEESVPDAPAVEAAPVPQAAKKKKKGRK